MLAGKWDHKNSAYQQSEFQYLIDLMNVISCTSLTPIIVHFYNEERLPLVFQQTGRVKIKNSYQHSKMACYMKY
jgi:hypothetical protein